MPHLPALQSRYSISDGVRTIAPRNRASNHLHNHNRPPPPPSFDYEQPQSEVVVASSLAVSTQAISTSAGASAASAAITEAAAATSSTPKAGDISPRCRCVDTLGGRRRADSAAGRVREMQLVTAALSSLQPAALRRRCLDGAARAEQVRLSASRAAGHS